MRLDVHVGAFAYPGRPVLLEDLRITMQQGEILAVLGPNGVGKTTLVKGMLGLIPAFHSSTLLDGKDIRELSTQAVWQTIGYVPQARERSSSLLVEEMILLGRSARIGMLHQPSQSDLTAVEKQMEQLGIGHLRGQACSTLSGGELQMVLMARALCNQPQLLMLDEPESNLDYGNQAAILTRILHLAQNKGIGSLLITHYPQHALQIADKALLLFPDRTHVFGHVSDVITPENLKKAYGVRVRIADLDVGDTLYQAIIVEDMPMRLSERGEHLS